MSNDNQAPSIFLCTAPDDANVYADCNRPGTLIDGITRCSLHGGADPITTPRCACGNPSEISTDTETGFVEQCRACYEQPRDTAQLPLHEQLRAWTDELKQLGDDLRQLQRRCELYEYHGISGAIVEILKKYALLS